MCADFDDWVVWERRNLSLETGHRISDGWPVCMTDRLMYAVGQIGNWGGTEHQGPGKYFFTYDGRWECWTWE